jgi:DNA helicase-2/ATP-dependent DNA helicase PcrA
MLFKNGIGQKSLEKISTFANKKGITFFEVIKHEELKLSQNQQEELKHHINTILSLRTLRQNKVAISKIINEIITRFNYLEYLKEDPETIEDRLENMQEFIAKAIQWEDEEEEPTIEKFLEEITLIPKEEKQKGSSIKLMTMHNGKGLEFTLVFLTGMEEDIFPHISSKGSSEELEEERRLCYVGMTRAKKILYLTAASYRFLWGETKIMQPSRFLQEINHKYVHFLSPLPHKIQPEEKSEENENNNFTVGTKVKHKTFGIGVIKKITDSSVGDIFEVYFIDDKITRTLASKYAKLIIAN